MKIAIGWPDKRLWPNGGGNWSKQCIARLKRAARNDAGWAVIQARGRHGPFVHDGGEIPVRLIVRAKPKGPLPDKDNCIAAIKVQLDAIAEQIGVNDRHFAAPVVVFETPRNGTMEVHIGLPESLDSASAKERTGERANAPPALTTNDEVTSHGS